MTSLPPWSPDYSPVDTAVDPNFDLPWVSRSDPVPPVSVTSSTAIPAGLHHASIFTKHYWLSEGGVLVRALRTAAQTAIAGLGVGTTNLFTADLKSIAALSLSAAVLSILMSFDRSSSIDRPNGSA